MIETFCLERSRRKSRLSDSSDDENLNPEQSSGSDSQPSTPEGKWSRSPKPRRFRNRRSSRKLNSSGTKKRSARILDDSEDERRKHIIKNEITNLPDIYTKHGTIEMNPVVLLSQIDMNGKTSLRYDPEAFLNPEAEEKKSDDSSSEDGDEEPSLINRNRKQKLIPTSDESEVEQQISKKRRRVNIEEDSSEDSSSEIKTENDQDVKVEKQNSESEKNLNSDSDSGDSMDDFVVSEDDGNKTKPGLHSEESNSSSGSSSDESVSSKKKNKSILAQLAPEVLTNLRNSNNLTWPLFQSIAKLYVKDCLNSKSIDQVYNDTQNSELYDEQRNALAVINKSGFSLHVPHL